MAQNSRLLEYLDKGGSRPLLVLVALILVSWLFHAIQNSLIAFLLVQALAVPIVALFVATDKLNVALQWLAAALLTVSLSTSEPAPFAAIQSELAGAALTSVTLYWIIRGISWTRSHGSSVMQISTIDFFWSWVSDALTLWGLLIQVGFILLRVVIPEIVTRTGDGFLVSILLQLSILTQSFSLISLIPPSLVCAGLLIAVAISWRTNPPALSGFGDALPQLHGIVFLFARAAFWVVLLIYQFTVHLATQIVTSLKRFLHLHAFTVFIYLTGSIVAFSLLVFANAMLLLVLEYVVSHDSASLWHSLFAFVLVHMELLVAVLAFIFGITLAETKFPTENPWNDRVRSFFNATGHHFKEIAPNFSILGGIPISVPIGSVFANGFGIASTLYLATMAAAACAVYIWNRTTIRT